MTAPVPICYTLLEAPLKAYSFCNVLQSFSESVCLPIAFFLPRIKAMFC